MATVTRGAFCTKARNWAAVVDKASDDLDTYLRVSEAGLIFATQMTPNATLHPILTAAQASRSVVSTVRCVPMIVQILSGGVCKKPTPDGVILTEKEESRSFVDQILIIILAVARFLSPLAWLHKLKVINLGKHTDWVNYTIMGASTAVGVGTFLKSLYEWTHFKDSIVKERKMHALTHEAIQQGMTTRLHQNLNRSKQDYAKAILTTDDQDAIIRIATATAIDKYHDALNEKKMNAISNFFELLAMPWDNGIVLFNDRTCSIVGSVICFVSAGFKLLRL